ncbi:uncharacterized protein YukE [Actinoplanes octamycinicus]|uniref:Uncharacterized protein YukE n=1 Tax=Actinoplanes octamycinicus TaxID=135948 RepID=A0A7W7H6X1_9ACTN|nr:hypothetical protein [Actinoplanes octamycinicus]MBB4745120.1 uncharacterized protein YukE [Actinoplanes octamycinicus]GIE55704.1 hypothetical protein Aoc01nite_11060 [Actinoplanes octamycinicus]
MSDTALAGVEAELIGKVLQLVDQIEEKTQQLHRMVERGLPFLPPPMRMQATTGWQKFCDSMADWWNFWREVAADPGSPSKLHARAADWTVQVGGPVSGQVQAVDSGRLGVDDNWDGAAAKAYRDLLPAQKDALTQIKATLTDSIGDAIESVATSLVVFWTALVVMIVPLVAAIAGATTSSATVIGIPVGVFIALGAAATAAVGLNVAIMVLKSSVDGATAKLRQKLGDDTAFGGGWPPTATGGPIPR